ncbi:hypothetical protein C4K03_4719 [Pseudomonas synxantha]|uniref:N-acetyltransferase domain-containing protein n=1 Tax=Pseudomonas synxantha TaxID=47883 RepID=A0A3G7UBW5_9PSED|nr:GNAT family N-acetyltransferase [Pseudomonas synxantha]AZE56857.1 hypothetical protein C4K03_4719 [Pseudomonas synxantha]
MPAHSLCDFSRLYYQSEDYYFGSLSPRHVRFNPYVNAYATDDHVNDCTMLLIQVGSNLVEASRAAVWALISNSAVPIRLALHHDQISIWQAALANSNFFYVHSTTAMILDLAHFRAFPAHEDLAQARSTDDLSDWAIPLGDAFGMSSEARTHYQARHQRALAARKSLHHFTLAAQGMTVCSLSMSIADQLSRLNDIGTLVAYRGKGYATRLIRVALARAISMGARWCFLEATEHGLPLYRKIGFKALFDYQILLRGAGASVEASPLAPQWQLSPTDDQSTRR